MGCSRQDSHADMHTSCLPPVGDGTRCHTCRGLDEAVFGRKWNCCAVAPLGTLTELDNVGEVPC